MRRRTSLSISTPKANAICWAIAGTAPERIAPFHRDNQVDQVFLRRRGQNGAQTSKHVVQPVRILARIRSDAMSAGILTRSGLQTGRGNRWIKERVTSLRSHDNIPCHTAERQTEEGWMNLTQAADFLHISSTTLRMALERGEIQAEHPFPGGSWIINRSILEGWQH